MLCYLLLYQANVGHWKLWSPQTAEVGVQLFPGNCQNHTENWSWVNSCSNTKFVVCILPKLPVKLCSIPFPSKGGLRDCSATLVAEVQKKRSELPNLSIPCGFPGWRNRVQISSGRERTDTRSPTSLVRFLTTEMLGETVYLHISSQSVFLFPLFCYFCF